MPDLFFAVPGGLDVPTGGAIYDRMAVAALREAGWQVEVLVWPGSFPFPSPADRQAVGESLAALPEGALVMIDGLALGTLPDLARAHSERLRLVALVHHPLALENGLPAKETARFAAEERRALRWARAAIVTSWATAATLTKDYAVPPERIAVAVPGLERLAGQTPPQSLQVSSGPLRILSLGQVVPRKAYHVLIEALASLTDVDFYATIAGDVERDPVTAKALAWQIACAGLADRVSLIGTVSDDELGRLLAQADLFAFPSLYEGYGMALAEAMAWGLPIVATTGGAIPEVVPLDAGVLVPPGDVAAFAAALRRLAGDPALRLSFAAGAKGAAARFPGWDVTAAEIAAALERV